MAKGTYTVGEGSSAPSSKDASFRSCLCALLIFIALCLIIILAGIKWSRKSPDNSIKEGEAESLGSKGNEVNTTESSTTSRTTQTKPTTRTPIIIDKKPTSTATTKVTSTQTSTIASSTAKLLFPITSSTASSTTSTTRLPNVIILQTEAEDTTTSEPLQNVTTQTSNKNGTQNWTQSSSTTQSTERDKSVVTTEASTATAEPTTVEGDHTSKELLIHKISTATTLNGTTIVPTTTTPTTAVNTTITTATAIPNVIILQTKSSLENSTESTIIPTTDETLKTNTEISTESSNKNVEIVTKLLATTIKTITTEESSTSVTENSPTQTFSTDITTNVSKEAVSPLTRVVTSTTERPSPMTPKRQVDTYYEGQKNVDASEYDYYNNLNITNTTLLMKKPDPICLSVGCKSAVSRMLSFMDHSVDACNDFYKFSCGGLSTDDDDLSTLKRLSEQVYLINETAPRYLRTFKTFYDSCVSHEYEFNYQDRIDGVLKLVKEVGVIFLQPPPKGTIDMTDMFTKLILRQSLPFIDIDIDIDKQTSAFILKLTLPNPTSVLKERGRWSALTEPQKRCLDDQRHELEQLNLDLTKIYESYLECQKNHAIYLNSVETVVKSLGYYKQLNNTFDESQRIQDLRTTIEWDILDHLNTLPPPSIVRQTMLFKNYTILRISDLQIQYPLLQWNRLLSTVTGRTLKNNTMVQVYFPFYFAHIFQKLQEVIDWKLNNALIAIYANNLYENLVIPQAKHTRENYCLKLSGKLFHDVSSNLYMRTWTKPEIEESQKFLTAVFTRLKQNMSSAMQKEEWLADASLTRAILKLNKMELIFNKESDSYNNEASLNHKYSDLTMTEDFQQNAVKMLEMNRKTLYGLVENIYSTDYIWNYFLNAYDSKPFSFYSKGLIIAPMGLIKQPVNGFPGYITMARIGLSLAREIGRHFDPVGIKNGMTLTPEAQTWYEELESVMGSESLFHVTKLVGHQRAAFVADPKLSTNERIADNTGFKLITDSFVNFDDQTLLPWVSSSLSVEQIFYITVAQEYCRKTDMPEFMQQLFESEILPATLRVENIVTNSKQFSKAFNCPTGSPMNNNPRQLQFPKLEDDTEEEEEGGGEEI